MRASQFVVASLLVGIAVVVAPGIRDSFPLPKSLVASTLGLLSVLLIAAVGAFSPAALERRLHWGQASAKIAAALCAAAVLSLVATRSMPHSSDALPALLVGATCLVGWSLLPGTGALLRWLLVPASLVAALGLLQVANIYSPLDIENAGAERLAMTSLVGSVGDLATFLVLPVLIAQFALFDAKAKKNGLEGALAGVALLLCAAALLVSQTLVALTAALAGTFAFWLLALPRRASVRALVGSVVAMVVALVAVAPLRVRVGAKLQQLLSGDINAVLSGRVDGWRVACAEFLEAPWTGVGHGAYVAEFTETKLRLLEQGAPFSTQHRLLSTFGNAHNELLEVAAEWGLAGLVALGLASWWLAGRLRRIEPSAERALAFGGSLAAFVLALGYFPFRLAVSAFPLVLFFSWVARIGSARSEPAPQEPAAEAQLARVRWISIAALIVLAVCVVLTVSRGRDSLAASRLLLRAEAQVSQLVGAARTPATAAALAANLKSLRRAAELDPRDHRIPLALGAVYLKQGNAEAAVGRYQAALELEPRPESYFNLGVAELQRGNDQAAAEAFRKAVKLDPSRRGDLPDPQLLER